MGEWEWTADEQRYREAYEVARAQCEADGVKANAANITQRMRDQGGFNDSPRPRTQAGGAGAGGKPPRRGAGPFKEMGDPPDPRNTGAWKAYWRQREAAIPLDLHGDHLAPHEIPTVERLVRRGGSLTWIPASRAISTNDFIWHRFDGAEFEMKTTKAKYSTIRLRIHQAVKSARENHRVIKENFLIDLGDATLTNELRAELARYTYPENCTAPHPLPERDYSACLRPLRARHRRPQPPLRGLALTTQAASSRPTSTRTAWGRWDGQRVYLEEDPNTAVAASNAAGPLQPGRVLCLIEATPQPQRPNSVRVSIIGPVIPEQTTSGTTPTGTWVRLPDGTQLCSIVTTRTDVAISTPYGSLYQGTWPWTYPMPFAAEPAVTCGRFQWGTGASGGTIATVTRARADLRGIDAFSRAAGTAVSISALAVGRWE